LAEVSLSPASAATLLCTTIRHILVFMHVSSMPALNPKHETRNSKQARNKEKLLNQCLKHLKFIYFPICFEFRHSDFEFGCRVTALGAERDLTRRLPAL